MKYSVLANDEIEPTYNQSYKYDSNIDSDLLEDLRKMKS